MLTLGKLATASLVNKSILIKSVLVFAATLLLGPAIILMADTRVHISLTEEQEHIVLRINNVSAYEINCEAEELFERSKRGDASRHTEGSGLGLAIAKSIVELQGGRLTIEVDGDYFKVTVMFIKQREDPVV